MASLTKVCFKSFLSRQIQKIFPAQVLASHQSTSTWQPPEKLDVRKLLQNIFVLWCKKVISKCFFVLSVSWKDRERSSCQICFWFKLKTVTCKCKLLQISPIFLIKSRLFNYSVPDLWKFELKWKACWASKF